MAKQIPNSRNAVSAAIDEEAQNVRKLVACMMHSFLPVNDLVFQSMVKWYHCDVCDGIVSPEAYVLYEQGFHHGDQSRQT